MFDRKMVLVFVGGASMSSDMSKCVNFSVFLDIAGVSKDAPSQKHQKCMYLIMFDRKMVLVFVGGVPMSKNTHIMTYRWTFGPKNHETKKRCNYRGIFATWDFIRSTVKAMEVK